MKRDTLKIDINKQRLELSANAVSFKEASSIIIFIPSLNITAYGDSLSEAKEMLEVCLNEFSKDMFLNFKTYAAIKNYLKVLGWKSNSLSSKKLIKLSETTCEDIIKEFDLPKSTVVESFEEKYSTAR